LKTVRGGYEGLRRRDITYIWHILVFAQQWKVEEDGERSCVCSEDNNFADTAVESFGSYLIISFMLFAISGTESAERTLVGSFLELAVMRSLLDDVEDFLGKRCVGNRPSFKLSVLL
jgi:hypothetical protein